ncbi:MULTISPECIES: hypothetical protein [unclassified Arthrobacter]|uniref:hypothetical protein n=1 Tax=unclassified Arthrobacter TaxID=235627 RepID=UPI002DFA466E|nr:MULTISPECIES: hypothetical protein [unclassified Arthrobacter]MEC5191375.1 quinol monooxygenase YgiN [Arthrobacter sp. MP_M4]MEC5202874.1 quinol monooxygenase YgiN [Arthrobacter sp. MP_M7]
MFTLQISYPVRDYEMFKKVFDIDPAGRAASGARSVRLLRDVDDHNSVVVHLDYESKDAASAFLARLRGQVWEKPEVMADLMTASPTAKIFEGMAREGQGSLTG